MLEVLNRNLVRTAYLEKASNVDENEPINDVGKLQFTLPCVDPKIALCNPFHFVRWISDEGDKGELFRIIRPETTKENVRNRTYLCEHVLAMLADSVMPGYHIIGNVGTYTADVIEYVLSFQTTKHWVLDECDFSRQFEYAWTNETVLNALWSIPNRFTEPYIWKVNTAVYPWRISLKRIDTNAEPKYFVRGGHNLVSLKISHNAQGVVTRIYPLGYGEGDNQLTIKSVNGGVEYLQSPDNIVEKYGIIERYMVDRRFEDAQSLKERAQAVLDSLQEPQMSATVNVSDIYQKSHNDVDRIENGRIVMIVDDENHENTKSYITSISRRRDQKGEARITIANKPTDIASNLADLADRQRIETVYSQGATQIYAQSIQANASASKGAILRFYIPSDMRIINFVNAKITLDRFRSYSKATGGGGAASATSDSGGGSTATSSSGGETSTSTQSGGGTSKSTESGGSTTATSGASSAVTSDSAGSYSDTYRTGGASAYSDGSYFSQTGTTESHTHGVRNHTHSIFVSIGAHSHGMAHTHRVTVPEHSHSFSVPAHSHSFTVPSHTHSVSIPSHSHSFRIPDHTHDITQGIFEFGNPTSAVIYVNGTQKATMGSDTELDISTYLLNDSNTIPRGSWLSVEVRPNDLAYVTIDLVIKGFCQSRGGSTY